MTMPTLLDGARIHAQRLRLGLTIAALAAQLGIGADLVRALEHGATSRIAALPVDVVLRLADTLHLAPADLFAPRPPDPTTAPASSADDRAIEAALLTHGDTITIDQLAEALGWPLGRLEHALTALDRRLQPTGIRLCRTGWHRYRIQPNHRALPEDACDLLDKAHHEHADLNLHTATLLGLLLQGFPLASKAWEGNDGLRQLRRQQLIDGDQPPFRLSADVRYSLLLEEYPE